MNIGKRGLESLIVVAVAAAGTVACNSAIAQGPPSLADAYPQREVDPEAVERGRALYETYACTFCHGEDVRGGAGGPSLLRSQLVQRDRKGETIAGVIRNGVPGTTMAAFPLEMEQIADIAEFLHSFELSSRDPARVRPESIVTGDPLAGERYFAQQCSGCHSVDRDLAGLASRYPTPRNLQQAWLMPRNAPPVRARITDSNGETIEGPLARIDEFIVSVTLPDGRPRTFRRTGDDPEVELVDPLAGHKTLLSEYTDPDIHDVTAYLVTLE